MMEKNLEETVSDGNSIILNTHPEKSCDLCQTLIKDTGKDAICQRCNNVLCMKCNWLRTKIEYMKNDAEDHNYGRCIVCEVLQNRGHLQTESVSSFVLQHVYNSGQNFSTTETDDGRKPEKEINVVLANSDVPGLNPNTNTYLFRVNRECKLKANEGPSTKTNLDIKERPSEKSRSGVETLKNIKKTSDKELLLKVKVKPNRELRLNVDVGDKSDRGSDVGNKSSGGSDVDDKSSEGSNVGNKSMGGSNVGNMSVGGSDLGNRSSGGSDVRHKSIGRSAVGNKSGGESDVEDKSGEGSNVGNKSIEGSKVGNQSSGASEVESKSSGGSHVGNMSGGGSDEGSDIGTKLGGDLEMSGTQIKSMSDGTFTTGIRANSEIRSSNINSNELLMKNSKVRDVTTQTKHIFTKQNLKQQMPTDVEKNNTKIYVNDFGLGDDDDDDDDDDDYDDADDDADDDDDDDDDDPENIVNQFNNTPVDQFHQVIYRSKGTDNKDVAKVLQTEEDISMVTTVHYPTLDSPVQQTSKIKECNDNIRMKQGVQAPRELLYSANWSSGHIPPKTWNNIGMVPRSDDNASFTMSQTPSNNDIRPMANTKKTKSNGMNQSCKTTIGSSDNKDVKTFGDELLDLNSDQETPFELSQLKSQSNELTPTANVDRDAKHYSTHSPAEGKPDEDKLTENDSESQYTDAGNNSHHVTSAIKQNKDAVHMTRMDSDSDEPNRDVNHMNVSAVISNNQNIDKDYRTEMAQSPYKYKINYNGFKSVKEMQEALSFDKIKNTKNSKAPRQTNTNTYNTLTAQEQCVDANMTVRSQSDCIGIGSDSKGTGSDSKGTGSANSEGTGSDSKGTGSADSEGTRSDSKGTGSDSKGTGSDIKGTGSADSKGTGSDSKGTGSDSMGTISDLTGDLTFSPTTAFSSPDTNQERTESSQAITKGDVTKIEEAKKKKKKYPKYTCAGCGRRDCHGQFMTLMREMIVTAKRYGFVIHNVVPDGNCMYAAVVDQLQIKGETSFSQKRLRHSAVDYLHDNPLSEDGTHYRMFVEGELWDDYLTRMSQEGQWGDHLILQAISQVTQKNINVLSGAENHKMTRISTHLAPENSEPLHLGHVGELHYVSLRPIAYDEQNDELSNEEEQEDIQSFNIPALEDTCKSIFLEDYIEPYSQIPALHFSYLIKNFLPLNEILDKSEKAFNIALTLESNPDESQEEISLAHKKFQMQIIGDVADRLYVPFLEERERTEYDQGGEWYDVDVLQISSLFAFPKGHDMVEAMDASVETDSVHPGYARLIANYPDTQNLKPGEKSGMTYYIPNKLMSACNSENLTREMKDYKSSSIGNMYFGNSKTAVSCPIWPQIALEWKTRQRLVHWPSKSLVDAIVADGCHLIGESHQNSSNPSVEFRFCFGIAERRLAAEALSRYQRYCYIVFKALCSQELKGMTLITSTHLKSIFFYACETLPAECWASKVGACIFYLIDRLLNSLQNNRMECYFIRKNNLIDHISHKEVSILVEKIQQLRTQPLQHLMSFPSSEDADDILDVFTMVRANMDSFRSTRNVRESVMSCFVPAKINQAKSNIKLRQFKKALDTIQDAYEERLSVSTCEDTLQFVDFLSEVVGIFDLSRQWWFLLYVDEKLGTTLSSDLSLKRNPLTMNEILGKGVCKDYSFILVPDSMTAKMCNLCIEFAWFLYYKYNTTHGVQILKICIDRYKTQLQNEWMARVDGSVPEVETDFTDENMFIVFKLLYLGYRRLQQISNIGEYISELKQICACLQTKDAYLLLSSVFRIMNDDVSANAAVQIANDLPPGNFDHTLIHI